MLQELLPDDLVWDGEAYVAHEGLVDQGKREVIEYDGVIGTPDHRVYVYEIEEEIELREASKRGYTLRSAGVSSNYEVALVDSVATNKE
jgi:DNA polymerase